MKKYKIILLILVSICVGILIGGFLFSHSQPRSLLALTRCQNCLTREDLLGLIASVGMQKFLGFMPSVVFETEKTIVVKRPFSSERVHYVIIPKKDIKNIGEISEGDAQYLIDAFLVGRWIIEREKLSRYRFYTNGPVYQDVTYLHFHLVAD